MSYISWDKKKLVNLEFTLNREVLRSNAKGAFDWLQHSKISRFISGSATTIG